MLDLLNIYINLFIFMYFFMTFWFLIGLRLKRDDIIDVVWGLNFIAISLVTIFITNAWGYKNVILTVMVLIWGIRLTSHIYKRFLSKNEEDFRYVNMKRTWHNSILLTFVNIYLLQGLLAIIVGSPIVLNNLYKNDQISILNYLGQFIWAFGIIFEAIADKQLKNFISDPNNKGKIMQSGLWKHSRHPNYFGEIILWWGIFIFSINTPLSLFGLIGPLSITILITKVSGIPLLEKKYKDNIEYEIYKKKTSILVPFFIKKGNK